MNHWICHAIGKSKKVCAMLYNNCLVPSILTRDDAKKIGAKYIAHGSTGAGNDQVRFDIIFQIMAPEIDIITPIRDNQLAREASIEFLTKTGVRYSLDTT